MAKSEWATGVLEDEYRLGPSLGDSAWFEVRAAERLRTGEKAVVKRHFDHLLDDQRFVGSILATRRRLAALDHPALVGVLDAAWDGRQLWSAEQFVGGRSLTAWLSEGWVTPLLGLHITQRLLLLLDEVHRLGIVHGALHPGTVRMSGRTEPRLGDFGLPTADPELTGPRSTGSLAFYGTYCAPEVLSGACPRATCTRPACCSGPAWTRITRSPPAPRRSYESPRGSADTPRPPRWPRRSPGCSGRRLRADADRPPASPTVLERIPAMSLVLAPCAQDLGFDFPGVDKEFGDPDHSVQAVVTLGTPDETAFRPRAPRLDYDEVFTTV